MSVIEEVAAERDADLDRLRGKCMGLAAVLDERDARIKALENALSSIARLEALSGGYGDMARAALEKPRDR
jgi:hypothetical protein